jgi:hypothetical protein
MDFLDRKSGLVLDLTAINLPVVDQDIPNIGARLPLGRLRAHGAQPQPFKPFGLAASIGREEFERVIERAHRGVNGVASGLCHKRHTNTLQKYHKPR